MSTPVGIPLPPKIVHLTENSALEEIRQDMLASEERWMEASRKAAEQFSYGRAIRSDRVESLNQLRPQFLRRRFCLTDLFNAELDTPWGAFLLASYWMVRPSADVVNAACEAILRASDAASRGLGWRVLCSHAVALQASSLDRVFVALDGGDKADAIQDRRQRWIDARLRQRDAEVRRLGEMWTSVDLTELRASPALCRKLMQDPDNTIRQAALFCGPPLHVESDFRRELTDAIEDDSSDDVAAIAAQSIAHWYFATEDPALCQELVRMVAAVGRSERRAAAALYALLSCCGLQAMLLPSGLLSGTCPAIDIALFADLADS